MVRKATHPLSICGDNIHKCSRWLIMVGYEINYLHIFIWISNHKSENFLISNLNFVMVRKKIKYYLFQMYLLSAHLRDFFLLSIMCMCFEFFPEILTEILAHNSHQIFLSEFKFPLVACVCQEPAHMYIFFSKYIN